MDKNAGANSRGLQYARKGQRSGQDRGSALRPGVAGNSLLKGLSPPIRVLLLDDEPGLQESFRHILVHNGCEVVMAASLAAGLEALQQQDFDVIVADVVLDDASGLEILDHVSMLSPFCCVVCISGVPNVDDAAQALRKGAFDYIPKPVGKDRLLQAVSSAARHARALESKHLLEQENERFEQDLEALVEHRTAALREANARLSREIAERERIEQALINQTMFMETLLSSIPTPVYYKDTNCIYLGCNQAFCEFVGREKDEIVGKTVFQCWPEHFASIYDRRDKELLQRGGRQEYEGPLMTQHDSNRHVLFKKAIFHLADGSTGGVIGIIVDTTKYKRLEVALLEASRQANAANLAKSEFLASMSHEIRTPMTAILGMADMLWSGALNQDQKRYVSIIRSAGENLLELISDILDLSRIESGKLDLEEIAFAPRDLLRKACDVMHLRAQEKRLELTCTIADDVPEVLKGDPARLNQILLNLLGNAIKFTESGSIDCQLELLHFPSAEGVREDVLHLCVQDSGIGIPPEMHESIFERFTQADASTTRRFGGTGLGLSICRHLTERMDGRIWVDSTPGQGSIFHVALPLKLARDEEVLAYKREHDDDMNDLLERHRNLEPLRILVADDSSMTLTLISELLKLTPHLLRTATNGAEALALFRDESFDVVLLDLQMPIMDGFEALQGIRDIETKNSRTSTPVYACSAGALDEHQTACKEAGFNGLLSKPFRRGELLETLAQMGTPKGKPTRECSIDPLFLVIDESAISRTIIRKLLQELGCTRIKEAQDAQDALNALQELTVDCVICDCDNPIIKAEALLREARAMSRNKHIPWILLASDNEHEFSAPSSLAANKDDAAPTYSLAKPFRLHELRSLVTRAVILDGKGQST